MNLFVALGLGSFIKASREAQAQRGKEFQIETYLRMAPGDFSTQLSDSGRAHKTMKIEKT